MKFLNAKLRRVIELGGTMNVSRPRVLGLCHYWLGLGQRQNENGHVLGLSHSSDTNAIMYPSYQQADCTLGQDDINGIHSLYP